MQNVTRLEREIAKALGVTPNIMERFRSKYVVELHPWDWGCWHWTAAKFAGGYASFHG